MEDISHLESELDITLLEKPTHELALSLLTYWESLREGSGQLPRAKSLDPVAIPKILPFICLVDVLEPGNKFVMRLMGTSAADFVQEDRTGKSASEIAANKDEELRQYLQWYWQKLCETSVRIAKPFHFRTTMNESERNYMTLEVSMYPMADDTARINRLLLGAFKIESQPKPL